MSKITRIAYSKNLTASKFNRLTEITKRLGVIRSDVWRRFGSVSGLEYRSDWDICKVWLADKKEFDVPARLWKATLSDVWDDIIMSRESAKVNVRRAIYKHTDDNEERKRLYTLLKSDRWDEDSYLHRMMREHFKHGHTDVNNQIVLDTGSYTTFEKNGKAWLLVQCLEYRKRIAIPLNTSVAPTKTLRLILRDGRVEVHYAVDEETVCSVDPCGDQTIGVDKGYTEVFTDSGGDRHGERLGEILSAESDYLKEKYQNRNRLTALSKKHDASGNTEKRDNILTNNLGRKKLDARKKKHRANVRSVVFNAAHTVVDKANTIAVEDLTSPIKDKKKYGKNQSRRLSGWVKGVMAEAINTVSNRRSALVVLVNASYTSQTDSRNGLLLGRRDGDSFYCYDGAVLDADWNAARNILARMTDTEIKRYTPFAKVKAILTSRTESRLGLLNLDTSCSPSGLSTVSEMPS